MHKYFAFILVAVCGAAGMFLLKSGVQRHTSAGVGLPEFIQNIWAIVFDPRVMLAIALYGIAMVAVTFIIAKFDVSHGFPVAIGINVLFTTLMAIVFLGEPMSAARLGGIGLILAGVYLINLGP